MQMSAGEEEGAQGVILAKAIDRGRIVVISDQNALGDAQLSYADNWRVWLNACAWAGRLDIDTRPLSIEAMAKRQLAQSTSQEQASTTFDQIVRAEPDRNATPTLPPGAWHVECWEDLSGGDFNWGSTDSDRYYFFWCWLNRWCWTSAHEGPSHPAPSGRCMLFVNEDDTRQAMCQHRLQQVLRQRGKVIVLGNASSARPEPTNAAEDTFESRKERLEQALARWMPPGEVERWKATTNWEQQPLAHAHLELDGASLLFIPSAELLQNASFTAPETAPDAMQSKWQLRLYHWLFEQS